MKNSFQQNSSPKKRMEILFLDLVRENPYDILQIEAFLKQGIDPNVSGENGLTALHHAVISGHLPLVEMLLQHKASVHVTDNQGNTPLTKTWVTGNISIVDILIKHGADMGHKNHYGQDIMRATNQYRGTHTQFMKDLRKYRKGLSKRQHQEYLKQEAVKKIERIQKGLQTNRPVKIKRATLKKRPRL